MGYTGTVLAILSALFVGSFVGFNVYRLVWVKEMTSGRLYVDFADPEQPKICGFELDGNCRELFSRSGVILTITSRTSVIKQ